METNGRAAMASAPTNAILARFCEANNLSPKVSEYLHQASRDNQEIVIAMQREISNLKSQLFEEKARTERLRKEVAAHERRWADLEASPAVRMVPVIVERDGDES
jgi:hypothetical protein